MITCHPKSKLLSIPRGQFSTRDEVTQAQVAAVAQLRCTAEAAQIRLDPDALYSYHPCDGAIVLRDLNDVPDAATIPDSEIDILSLDRPAH